MASFNRVILLGNLTRDPELRYTPSGMAVTDIGLAVNDRRKNANGEWVDETTFVDVTLWGRTAEIAGEYLTKGSPTLIEGRLKMDSWDDKQTGQKRSKLKVVGERLQLLGAKGQGGSEGGGPRPPRQSAQNNAYSQAAPSDDSFDAGPPAEPSGGDEIPF
jgi:single-strand DNA-binding protein